MQICCQTNYFTPSEAFISKLDEIMKSYHNIHFSPYRTTLLSGKTHCSLTGKVKGGLVVVFSLGSSPTVDTKNQAKSLQSNINSPLSVSGPRFNGIYKMPNKKKNDRNCISLRYSIRNINEQHQLLGELHISEKTFRVVLRTGLWLTIASPSEAGRGDSK